MLPAPPAGHRPSSHRHEWVPRGPSPSAGVLGHNPSSSSSPLPSTTTPDPRRRSRRRGGAAAPPRPEPGSVPQLVQEIQDKLARGTVECMICCDTVRRSAPIWSCSSCFSIFHLACTRKWARSPTASAAPNGPWRCPGCQSVHSADLYYTCFCARRRDPPNDLYLTPHSCGEPCRKPLDADADADGCPHVCVLQCHPGPCPPCKAFAPPRPCPCGKASLTRRCADKATPLTCGQRCGRLLSCGRHRCDDPCHAGDCSPCRVQFPASCFCNKKSDLLLCGSVQINGGGDGGGGVFSCGAPCGKTLNCGNHSCSQNCHPGDCLQCELMPHKTKTCNCGKTELRIARSSCLDPIPNCEKTCGKLLLGCATHRCPDACHEGACPPCSVEVNQNCRCGSSKRSVECYKAMEERAGFACDRPCGRKKNCGRHRCSERCCPLSEPGRQLAGGDWDPHLCLIPCGKKLRCGQHSCQLLCHTGHCPPCLDTIFTDLFCACGETSIPPPLPCGTPPPSCPHPCLVPQPCGHSASHTCHSGDCPPCPVPVVKECVGEHVMLRNMPCSSRDIRCNQLCGKTRQCGMHACSRTCHPSPCDPPSWSAAAAAKSSCGQVCGAPRRECKHTCSAPCHPMAPCPDLRCDYPATIACSCGRITASVPCCAGGGPTLDTVLEESVLQRLPQLMPAATQSNGRKVPLGQRKLCCDDECAKLERKRVLAEAFDVTHSSLDALHFGGGSSISSSPVLLADTFRREPKWVVAVEERFKFLVMGKLRGGTANRLRSHVFCAVPKEKRDAIRQIAERWKLSVHAAGWEPKRFLVVQVTPKSKRPDSILGSNPGVSVTAPLHPVAFDPLIDMDPRFIVAMFDLPRDADISALALRFGGECELVWLNKKNALAVFADPIRAATALRLLDHGSAYQGAAIIVVPNGGPSAHLVFNAWGAGAKDGGVAAKNAANPWKTALASKSESWGAGWSSTAASATVPVWEGKKPGPIPHSVNRWNVLDPDVAADKVTSEQVHISSLQLEGDLAIASRISGLSSAVQGEGSGKGPEVEEVDDWEDADL